MNISLVYILPPIINTYGELFSVAQLMSLGYASFVSSGKPPKGPIDMTSFFYPRPCPLFDFRYHPIIFLFVQ